MITTDSKVKLKIDGVKYRAFIRSVTSTTPAVDVTYGGGLGGDPDFGHRYVPGRRVVTVTLEIEESPS